MSKLTKAVALVVLALWALAAMHCKLEVLPGLDFLKTCCFVDALPSPPADCEDDGCGAVEEGGYRLEEQTVSAPLPLLLAAPTPLSLQIPRMEPRIPIVFPALEPPPELTRTWQFSRRAALAPRAPSAAS